MRILTVCGCLFIASAIQGQENLPQTGTPPASQNSQAPAVAQTSPPGSQQSKGQSSENDPFDREWSIELFYWLNTAHPDLKGGAAASDYETLDFPGRSAGIPGAQASLRLTPHDYIRVSYFRMTGSGTSVSSQALDLFGTDIPASEYLAAKYRLNVLKLSFEDLLYPYPNYAAKLTFKTLWEVQMAKMDSRIDAPFDTSTTDGYTTFPSAIGTLYTVLPTLGMAVRYAYSQRIHLELRSSGFGIPHHQDILDCQASAGTWIGRTELSLGAKLYHFKTSPQGTEYVGGTVIGGFIGVQWGAVK